MKVYRLVLVLFFQILLAVISCRESDKEMKISTGKVTNILNNSADVEGFIIDIGIGAVQYGHCYDKTPNVSDICLITQKGVPTGPGNYSSHLIDLEAGTKYYVRAYIDNGHEIVYGEEVSFTTLPPSAPAIITSSINSITPTSAISGGSVVTDGGSPIVARGVCWSTTPNPTTSNSLTIDGVGSGDFVSNISGLKAGTTYYIRAYATNEIGTGYGNQMSFSTIVLPLPSAITNDADNVSVTTANLNGNVNANGLSTIVTFEYGKTISYGTIINSLQSPLAGNINTLVNANISGLEANTTYHFRVKAESEAGTSLGSDKTFTTNNYVAPTSITYPASIISMNTATLVGRVIANGENTTVTFEFGTTSNFGTSVPGLPSPVAGNLNKVVRAKIDGLSEKTTYYFRVKAESIGGTTYGSTQSFITTSLESCPPFEKVHTAGDVAPSGKTITYGTVVATIAGETKCWITQNLGAQKQASASSDLSTSATGWYWQFNKKQGYEIIGGNRYPGSSWINPISESSNWLQSNDPCAILLGSGWRIPTDIEWRNVCQNWQNSDEAYSSILKLHKSGDLYFETGTLNALTFGNFWSSSQDGFEVAYGLRIYNSGCDIPITYKASGFSLRCVKD